MDRTERSALIASPSLSGVKVLSIYVTDMRLPAFEVVNSDGSRIPFDMGNTDDYPAFTDLLTRLGVFALGNTDELVGLTYDGDGMTDEQRAAALLAKDAETKRTAHGLHFKFSEGGSMGGHQTLMLDGKYVGHLYIDASEGVDVDAVLADIETSYNERRLVRPDEVK